MLVSYFFVWLLLASAQYKAANAADEYNPKAEISDDSKKRFDGLKQGVDLMEK